MKNFKEGKNEMKNFKEIIDELIEKDVSLPNTKLMLVKFGKDSNGNSIAKFKNDISGKSFSIQTNGNLPNTHRIKTSGYKIKELKDKDLEMISKEVIDYVKKYGTKAQKDSL